jgi:hypothetical protein
MRQRAPERIVVKEYGRDSILFAAVNPVMSAIMVSLGLNARMQSEERLALRIERDAVAMRQRGYRIASTHEYRVPLFGVTYRKVTYELIEAR